MSGGGGAHLSTLVKVEVRLQGKEEEYVYGEMEKEAGKVVNIVKIV